MDASWWQRAVIYQVYPRSFQDTNGDGVGDLPGIVARLPYLADLGIDAIWLSPIFPSPMADFGYDVADYTDVDPLFGTLADLDRLVEGAHRLGIRVLLDLVPNHTSDRHPWFAESRSSRTSAKRDWYIWRDPAPGGGPPNNWLSEFGGSAWQYDEATGQYYYHAFLAAQPDLNWRNPEVRAAMFDAMRFWFRRGIDGFRVDVIWHLIKDDLFRDNPANPEYTLASPPHHAVVPLYTTDRPEVHDVIADMRRVADEFPGRLLIGEIYLPIERLMTYYGRDLSGVHLPFNFTLLSAPWNAPTLARLIREYEEALPDGGWPNWVLGNHDRPRIASRVGPERARLAAMLLLTLRGTPTIYYGDEIGMEQVAIPPERIRDPIELNIPGHALGRDGCRTPMQWDGSPHAGFSTSEPWLPLAEDRESQTAGAQIADEASLYHLYRQLIALRRSLPTLAHGTLKNVAATDDVLTFERIYGEERLLIALNLNSRPARLDLSERSGELVLSTQDRKCGEDFRDFALIESFEGLILKIA
jgi:alpha-glucosidase